MPIELCPRHGEPIDPVIGGCIICVRELLIEQKLELGCNCTFPNPTYRNGSGHDENCPVHIEYLKENRR